MRFVRSGHLIVGVALIVIGYAVLVLALTEQAQRASVAAAVPIAAEPAGTAAAAPAADPPPAASTAPPSATAAASTVPVAMASAAVSAAAPADGTADPNDGKLFKFSPGGAAMAREEVDRLMAYGKVLARHPQAKVAVEGFGDRPGTEPLMVGIAKHRAKVTQMLLTKAGVGEDRVTISFVDMGQEMKLARSIRITTMPPLAETEKP